MVSHSPRGVSCGRSLPRLNRRRFIPVGLVLPAISPALFGGVLEGTVPLAGPRAVAWHWRGGCTAKMSSGTSEAYCCAELERLLRTGKERTLLRFGPMRPLPLQIITMFLI